MKPFLVKAPNILSPPMARNGARMPLMSLGSTPANLVRISACPKTSEAHLPSSNHDPSEWVMVWEAISCPAR